MVDGKLVHVPKYAIVLVFTPDHWAKADAQVVSVIAVNDTVPDGDQIVVVSHSVISADAAFDHAAVRNVEVTVHDDDLPAIQVVQIGPDGASDNATVVIEGTSITRLADAFDVRLSVAPTSDVVVEL